MNIDAALEIASSHYFTHRISEIHVKNLMAHYATSELRLMGKDLEQFMRRVRIDMKLLRVVELDRFFYWYYINYVNGSRMPVAAKSTYFCFPQGHSFDLPSSQYASLIKRPDDQAIGIVMYCAIFHQYRTQVERCVSLHFCSQDATVLQVKKVNNYLDHVTFMLHYRDDTQKVTVLEVQKVVCL